MIVSGNKLGLFFKKLRSSLSLSFIKFFISLFVAIFIAFYPEYVGLSEIARVMFFILLFGAFLWLTEAIPAFAVSLLIIALEMLLLGFYDNNSNAWRDYLTPWANPLIFLFLAGFIMASAASKTKLDIWLAKKVLFYVGHKPENILFAIMAITFTISMFISNTATAAMMLSIIISILKYIDNANPFQKALLLGVVVATNIGGMGTIIATPANAIAVGMLGDKAPNFVEWMIYALPPAIIITFISKEILYKLYPSTQQYIRLDALQNVDHYDDSTTHYDDVPTIPSWKKIVVIVGFFITVIMWMTEPLHHIPTTVISFIPIVAYTLFGIIDSKDINSINWDIIILIIGGLTLGFGVTKTGLDLWIATLLPEGITSILLLLIICGFIVVLVSTFMSNTATANIMLPIVVALTASLDVEYMVFAAIYIALCSSFGISLPVSTPPNAIIYSSNKLASKDFLIIGSLVGLFAPLIVFGYLYIVL